MFVCTAQHRQSNGDICDLGNVCIPMQTKEGVLGEFDLVAQDKYPWVYAYGALSERPIERLFKQGFSGWDESSRIAFRIIDCRHTRRPNLIYYGSC